MADVVEVGDVRLLLLQQGVNLSGGVEGVEKARAERDFLPQRNIGAIVINLVHEKGGVVGRFVPWVSCGKDDDGMAFFPEKAFQEEKTGLRSPEREIELIDEQDVQTSMLLASLISLSFPRSFSAGGSGFVNGRLPFRGERTRGR
jgi:hypothetical protein